MILDKEYLTKYIRIYRVYTISMFVMLALFIIQLILSIIYRNQGFGWYNFVIIAGAFPLLLISIISFIAAYRNTKKISAVCEDLSLIPDINSDFRKKCYKVMNNSGDIGLISFILYSVLFIVLFLFPLANGAESQTQCVALMICITGVYMSFYVMMGCRQMQSYSSHSDSQIAERYGDFQDNAGMFFINAGLFIGMNLLGGSMRILTCLSEVNPVNLLISILQICSVILSVLFLITGRRAWKDIKKKKQV